MPRTIAPTKAKARYAVNTLSRLTKVMGKLPLVYVTARINGQPTSPFPPQKVSAAVLPAGSNPGRVVKDS